MDMAIVGCGVVAQDHLNVLTKMKILHPVAVCDKSEPMASKVAKKWNIEHCYTNFSEMIQNEDISLVSILTPPESHAPLAVDAINHGVNVLVEKPFTSTARDAELILGSLGTSKAKLTVNYVWLFNDTMVAALPLIRKGLLGEVLAVEIKCLQTTSDPMAANENHWCHKLPGGRFGEMLPHPVYVMQSILEDGLGVAGVSAIKRGPYAWMSKDELLVFMQSKRGIGQIYVSFNCARPAILVDVYGTNKILHLDFLNQNIMLQGPRSFSKVDSAVEMLGLASHLTFATIKNTLTYLAPARGERAIRRVYSSFVEDIDGDRQPAVTPEMACRTVKLVEDITYRI
jgi:predicted dehydrogenase